MSLRNIKRLEDLNAQINNIDQQIANARNEYNELLIQAANELFVKIRDEFRTALEDVDFTVQEQSGISTATYGASKITCVFRIEACTKPTLQIEYQAQGNTKTILCNVINRLFNGRGSGISMYSTIKQTELERKEEELTRKTAEIEHRREKIQNFSQDDSYRLDVSQETSTDPRTRTNRGKRTYNSLTELLNDLGT